MMSVHVNNNCAKRKNLVAHLLTVREVLAAEGVDMHGLGRLERNG